MIVHTQRARRDNYFYEPQIAYDPNGGLLTLPSGTLWIRDQALTIPALFEPVGGELVRVWLEPITPTSVDYLIDKTMEGEAVAFPEIGRLVIAWRERIGDDLHVLRHVDA